VWGSIAIELWPNPNLSVKPLNLKSNAAPAFIGKCVAEVAAVKILTPEGFEWVGCYGAEGAIFKSLSLSAHLFKVLPALTWQPLQHPCLESLTAEPRPRTSSNSDFNLNLDLSIGPGVGGTGVSRCADRNSSPSSGRCNSST
jgi:hypothetical protein